MDKLTEAERRNAMEQSLASARIEGHEPTPQFLADCEAVMAGTMTSDELVAAIQRRMLAKSRAAGGIDGL